MADDDFANGLARTYANMHSAGDLRNRLAGDPSIPPPTPYENVMEQARGLHSTLTHADPVEMAMGLLGPRIPFPARISNPIRAYHGSPHDFDKFDLSKIGTGEGAQAYGHGLYFAENPSVANSYKNADGSTKVTLDGKPITKGSTGSDWLDAELGSGMFNGPDHFRAVYSGNPSAAPNLNRLDRLVAEGRLNFDTPKGKMYEVALHATPEQFLDWDKPLSGQHPQVRSALEDTYRSAAERAGYKVPLLEQAPASEHLQSLTNAMSTKADPWKTPAAKLLQYADEARPAVAQALSESGIPGIKYLDQGSRPARDISDLQGSVAKYQELLAKRPNDSYISGLLSDAKAELAKADKGTHNYVVWSPEIIEILRKYGLMGPAALGAASATLPPDKAPQQ